MNKRVVILLATLASLLPALAFAASTYTVTILQSLGGLFTTPAAINREAEVAGTVYMPDGSFYAAYWKEGKLSVLWQGFGLGINKHGTVVGQSYPNFIAMVGDRRGGTPLPLPPGYPSTSARAIANDGIILVNAHDFGYPVQRQRAFVYDNGKFTDLGALPGNSNVVAYAINSRDEVVGISGADEASGARPFLWKKGKLTDLSNLWDRPFYPYAINKDRTIVGTSTAGNIGFRSSKDAGLEVLGPDGGNDFSSINKQGDTVGAGMLVKADGSRIALLDLLGPGWEGAIGVAVNNKGQIAGWGWQTAVCQSVVGQCPTTAFVLTPTDEQ